MIALALACFGSAQVFGGSGFIASFVGGLIFGALFKPHHEDLLGAAEGIGDTFALLTWVLFGSAVVGQSVGSFSWQILLYAVLSLTVIRMLPVFVSVTGLGYDIRSKLFLGWFGPRGLASIVFAMIVLDSDAPHRHVLSMCVACTVLLSILLHGMTANPLARAFGASERGQGGAG